MIKAIILLGTVFINTDIHAVPSADVVGSLEPLPHSRQVVAQGVQAQAKDWFSLSPREKMNRVKALPRVTHQKRCSDMDTVLNDCKEQPGSIEEAHQRTALAYSRRLGSH